MWEAERGGEKHEWEGAVFPRVHGKLKALLTTYSRKAPISEFRWNLSLTMYTLFSCVYVKNYVLSFIIF